MRYNHYYRASIFLSNCTLSDDFETIADAMHWLDARNHNQESRTVIVEMDGDYATDWFVYTKGTNN